MKLNHNEDRVVDRVGALLTLSSSLFVLYSCSSTGHASARFTAALEVHREATDFPVPNPVYGDREVANPVLPPTDELVRSRQSTSAFAPANCDKTATADGDASDHSGPQQTSDFVESSAPLNAFSLQLNPGPGLAENAAALGAFQRAAQQWQRFITDPVIVNIDADFREFTRADGELDMNTVGQVNSVLLEGSYNTIRRAMVRDSSNEPDDTIVASLPNARRFTARLPADVTIEDGVGNFELDGNVILTRANAKALGFRVPGPEVDAVIQFNSNFSFDTDNSDGVNLGELDLETVALHEIGHALGFTSAVDVVDFVAGNAWQDPNESPTDLQIDLPNPFPISPHALDLFRFRNGDASSDPAGPATFTTGFRDLNPGSGNDIFDQVTTSPNPLAVIAAEQRMSTGVILGNGFQASHWFPDEQSGVLIGAMDPTLAPGLRPQFFPAIMNVSGADLRALDLIGWEINQIPEPSGLMLGSLMIQFLGMMRIRNQPVMA